MPFTKRLRCQLRQGGEVRAKGFEPMASTVAQSHSRQAELRPPNSYAIRPVWRTRRIQEFQLLGSANGGGPARHGPTHGQGMSHSWLRWSGNIKARKAVGLKRLVGTISLSQYRNQKRDEE